MACPGSSKREGGQAHTHAHTHSEPETRATARAATRLAYPQQGPVFVVASNVLDAGGDAVHGNVVDAAHASRLEQEVRKEQVHHCVVVQVLAVDKHKVVAHPSSQQVGHDHHGLAFDARCLAEVSKHINIG